MVAIMSTPLASVAAILALSATTALAIQGSCPAGWSQNPGVCIWPKQQAYKNISVAGADDYGAACCAACAADPKCVEWLVYTAEYTKDPKGTCILNNAFVKGQAPASSVCISGSRPPTTWPPTPPPKPAPKGAKNVLFFAVDDLRPDLNAYGNIPIPGTVTPKMHTPNFDRLAGESIVLLKNYVQQAVCSPTRTSLLSGRRPDRTHVYDLFSYVRTVGGNYTTIPEFFLQNGYKTQGMGKIFHPGHASGNDDSCCSWTNASAYFHAPDLGYWSGTDPSTTGSDGKSWMSVSPSIEAANPLPDNQTADHAVQALAQLKAEAAAGDTKPWFLAVGFHKPHLPFVASEQFFDLYPAEEIQLPTNEMPPEGMPPVAWSNYGELLAYSDMKQTNATGNPGTLLPKNDILELRRAYYAAVSQTDFMLGKVLDALDASGFAENTVISIWGDHGWQLGEHGEWCKHTNWEFATRAPMIIHVPGLTDGGINSLHYSEHVDLFPTLTEAAAGITLDPCPPGDGSFKVALCTEGTSLVPLMKPDAKPVKDASFSQYPRGYQKTLSERGTDLFAVDELTGQPSTSQCILKGGKGCTMGYTVVTLVDGHEYRYTEWADFNTPGFPEKVNWDRNVGVELYNHTADPGENININATMKNSFEVKMLSAKLSAKLRAGPTYGPQA